MRKILFFLMAIVFALQGWTQTPATLPYSCDFESPTEVLEWTISNSTSTNKWAYGAAANGGVINGNSLFISNDGVSYAYSISPAAVAGTVTASRKFISNGVTNYQLSFDLNIGGESSSDYLKIYVLPKDSVYNGVSGATFPFFAVSGFTSPYLVSKNGSNNFLNLMQNRVFLTIPSNIMGNVGDTMQVVFVWKNDGSIGAQPPAAIDNVNIISTSCDSPTALAVPSATITSNSAIVNWTPSANNGSFTLEYKKSSQTWAQAILIQNANSGLTLSNLNPNTDYNIRLKADCFGVEGIYNFINLKTLCGNISSYPWFEGFESTWAVASGLSNATTPDNCWINFNSGASTSYLWRKSSTSTVPAYVRTGTGAAQFYGANNSGIMGDYLISPVFSLTGNEKINFWAKGYSSTTKYNEPIWIKLHNVTQNGDIQSQADTTLFIDLAFINDTNQYTWNNYEYSLSNFTGNYRIVFARMGASPGYNFQMDDLSISTIPSCASPFNIKATNPHSTSVNITFTPAHQTDASWYIYYNNVSTSVWDSVLCTTTNFTLSGLSPNSKYSFAIKTLCGSSLSALSPVYLFQTTCAEISTLPWSDSFDTYGTGTTVFPGCWTKNTTLSGPYVNTTNFSSPGSFYFNTATTNTQIIAATPPFSSTIPINTLLAKFKYRNANMNNFICVGAMSDPSDETTFVCIDTIRGTTATTWEDFQVSFASYTGNGNYIAFKLVHNGVTQTGYIDNLIVEAIPNCQPPTVFSANNVTSNTIDIVWTPVDPSHNMWWLYYKNSDSTHYDSISVTGIAEQHITNLNPNTSYDYYIVSACGLDLSPASFLGSFTTTCYGISQFPYYESFDTYSAGTGILPTCWMRNSSVATAPYINTTNHTPPNSLYFITAAGNRTSAILVIDSIVPINTLRVKFNMRSTSTNSKLQVGVMADPNDFSTFVPVGAKQILNQASVWEEKEVLFDNYTGNGRFIALVSSETAASNVYVDDLVIDYIPTCKKPSNLTATNITISDATISWTPGNSGDLTWYLYYKNTNSSLWDSVFVVGAPTYTLSNLSSGTEYELYIRTECGLDYSEPSLRPYSFITTCSTISSFPYTESFDNWGTGTGKYPRCWSKNSSSYTYPYIDATNNTAPGSLRFYSYSSYPINTAILPMIDNSVNVNTLMVKFKMYHTSLTTILPIQVGLMTDTADITTFTPVGSPQTITATSSWEEKIVLLDTYTGTGKYIAFKVGNSTSTIKYAYMDDLVIDVIPLCSRPTSVSVSNITTNSAQISWVPDSPSDINFKVFYKKTSDLTWDSIMVASATTATLNNLIHSTDYDIEVRTQCPNGSYSDGLSGAFSTACGDIASLPYNESFDNWGTGTGTYPNCWTRNSSASGAPYINTTSSSAPGGLYFYSATGDTTTAILPAIDINIPINSLRLKFKMQYTSITDGLQVGVMTDTNNISTFIPVGLKQKINSTSVWENKEVSFSDYTGTGRYIAIMGCDTIASNYARIDDLVIDYIPVCANPTDIKASSITTNSAKLSWKSGNSYDNAWWLFYKPSSSTTYDSIYMVSNPYTLQSLTVDTYYDYYIVTDCGGQLSSPSVTNKFKTACLPISTIPYTESFDNYGTGTGKYPSCWYRISQYSTTPYINTTNFSSPGSLYLTGNNGADAYAIFGPVDNTISLDTLVLKFKMYYTSLYAEIQAGVMTDPYDFNTFVPVGSLQTQIASSTWEDKEVALASYNGNGRYIALKTNSPNALQNITYAYIDNVVLDYIPACAKPTNLEVGLLTSTSAQIKWTNGNVNSTAWKLYYKASTALGYDSVSISTQSPYLLQGLIPQTTYSYYMRTDCGTEVSDPTLVYTFTTPCTEITTLPWVEGFETYGAAGSFPPCWSRPIIYSTYPKTSTTASRVHSGTSSLEIHSALTPPTYAITPAFGYDINTLRVKFWAMAESITSSGTLEVGVMSNPNDISTFESVSIIQPLDISYKPYEISFANTTLTGLNRYIAFRQNTVSTTYYYWIDDIEVSLIPSCSAPTNIVASNFDTNKVNISWTNGDANDNAWWLYYKSSSSLLFDSVQVTAQSPYSLTNLTPSTEYIIYMRTDCGNKLSDISSYTSFYTACKPITTFPWTEGFDASWVNANGIGNEARPTNCWVNINGGASLTYKWRANTSVTYNRTGSGSAQLYASNNVMSDYLFTPKFNFSGNERLRFWYKGYQSTSFYPENIWIKAYNVSANGDIDNASDTTLLVTLDFLTDTNCYTWKEYELNLTSLVGEYRIAFVRDSNNKIGYYFNIDDMIIDAQPSCKRPTNLTATNIQNTTATISWTSPSPTQTSWILYYQDISSTTYDSVIVNNANTYTLTNLNSGATYGYLMVALCGTNVSEQTNPLFFTTICNPITSLPWMEGFESSWVNGTGISNDMVPNTCWVNINGGTSLSYKWRKNATTTNPAYARTGSGSAQLYATNDPMGDYLMTPIIALTGNQQLSFWGKGYSSSTNYPENIWVKAYNVTANGEIDSYSDTTLFTNIYFINDTNQYTWKNYEIPLTNLVGNYRLVFGRNNSVGYNYHIDDLVVDIISACPKPTTVSVSNITSSTADIAWTPGTPTDAAWKIYFRKSGTQAWDSVHTTATPHTLIGLEPGTSYEIGVATNCGNGSYSGMVLSNFVTLCAAISIPTPIESFQTVLPNICWSRFSGLLPATGNATLTTSTVGWVANNYVSPKNIKVNLYSTQNYWLVTPSIDLASGSAANRLEFDLFLTDFGNADAPDLSSGYNNKRFIALISTDDGATWTASNALKIWDNVGSADTLNKLTNVIKHISIPLVDVANNPYSGIVKIAFYGESTALNQGDNDLHIDNFQVTGQTCNIPTALTATNITSNSADISWIAGGTETSWQIKQGSTGTPISVTSTTYQATGLTPNTSYNYYVRANCAAGVYSAWTMVTFATPVMPTNPTVTTSNISTFTHNTATFNGSYTQGTDAVSAVGFVYKTSSATSWTTQTLTSTTSPFTYNAAGLTPNTLYKVRAFATTQAGTFYGDTSSFTTLTLNPPTVTTTSVTNVTATTATFNGTTAPGTESIVSRGFEYKTNAQTWTSALEVTATGSTTITANVTGLVNGTTYNVRAYAETASGKTYGSEISFIAGTSVVLGEVTTLGTTNIATTSATLNGSVVNVGGAASGIEVGFVYSTITNPVINGTNVIKVPVTYTTGMTNYNSNITGLTDTTQYYVKSYITNSAGTAYGQEMTFITRKSGLNDIDVNSMSVQLYPNPATTEATLVIKGITGKAKIMISDVQGRTINTLETVGVNGEASQKLNLSNYAKGIYYIRIQNAKVVNTQKLIVE